jgi:Flp pilus assembly pilin Flp
MSPLPPRRSRGGPTLREYALILTLVIIVVVVALVFLGGHVATIISDPGTHG